jgi:trigger factor
MQVTETLSEGLKRGFTVLVPGTDIEAKRTARLTDLGRTLRLPGFRPGKVPLQVVRQRYGTAVTAEVLEESVNEATQQVLTERNLRPAQTPKVDLVSVDTGAGAAKDLEFKVEFEALPEIVAPDFSQIALVRRKVAVAPEKVDETLAEMARRNRTLDDITPEELAARTEPSGAANGEVLTIDYVGKIDDVAFTGGTGKDAPLELGENSGFIPGFAEQLVGMSPGETRTIAVTFPEDYGSKDLAGKAATFDVTAKKLSRPVVPTHEELATKLAFEDVGELRTLIERRMQQEYDQLARLRLKRELLDALAQRVDFAVPQGMLDQEFDQIWQRLEAERKEGRLDEDDKDKDEATLRADYRAIAERRVRLGLLLAEIGRSNGITVTEQEMNAAKRAEAGRYPGQEAQMMEFFRKYPQAEEALRGPIFEEKVVDLVLELAQVTEQMVTFEELSQEPEAAVPAAASAPETTPAETSSAEAPPAEAVPAQADTSGSEG